MRSRHVERHLVDRIGWLRAAVLGANDGIISMASLTWRICFGEFAGRYRADLAREKCPMVNVAASALLPIAIVAAGQFVAAYVKSASQMGPLGFEEHA
jgi:vacuolar iron transporter family protein